MEVNGKATTDTNKVVRHKYETEVEARAARIWHALAQPLPGTAAAPAGALPAWQRQALSQQAPCNLIVQQLLVASAHLGSELHSTMSASLLGLRARMVGHRPLELNGIADAGMPGGYSDRLQALWQTLDDMECYLPVLGSVAGHGGDGLSTEQALRVFVEVSECISCLSCVLLSQGINASSDRALRDLLRPAANGQSACLTGMARLLDPATASSDVLRKAPVVDRVLKASLAAVEVQLKAWKATGGAVTLQDAGAVDVWSALVGCKDSEVPGVKAAWSKVDDKGSPFVEAQLRLACSRWPRQVQAAAT
ncbi:hypothetical protein FOA52_012711 [Chlamydomonas sp. UWO 241]|nr:hypothetical protein FOA52_012711 [Chlamydomonas sp. UWO 241]